MHEAVLDGHGLVLPVGQDVHGEEVDVPGHLRVPEPKLPHVRVGERHRRAGTDALDLLDELLPGQLAAQQGLVADDDRLDALGVRRRGAQCCFDLLGVVLGLAADPDAQQHVEVVSGGELGHRVEPLPRAVGAHAAGTRCEVGEIVLDLPLRHDEFLVEGRLAAAIRRVGQTLELAARRIGQADRPAEPGPEGESGECDSKDGAERGQQARGERGHAPCTVIVTCREWPIFRCSQR